MCLWPELGRVILEAGGEQFARAVWLGQRVGILELYGHQRPHRSFVRYLTKYGAASPANVIHDFRRVIRVGKRAHFARPISRLAFIPGGLGGGTVENFRFGWQPTAGASPGLQSLALLFPDCDYLVRQNTAIC